MFKNIPNDKKLLVISDTGILKTANGYRAFGPVVKELEYLLELFEEITWVGFEKLSQKDNASYIKINSSKIKPILLKEVGGKSLKSKINILKAYPLIFRILCKEIKKHTYIHTRAPSNPAFIAMFLSLFFMNKKFWHKYAGTWVDNASFFYKVQRNFLKNIRSNNKITINGNFSSKKNILSFENPCLNEKERATGKSIIKSRVYNDKINFCFVGALIYNKGVDDIISALKNIDSTKIGEIHFVGSGPKKDIYLKESASIKYHINFHGFLAKDDIVNIYRDSHFILLPSRSEGFPKVIGEAMNYGCIPIVSNISCIGEYIQNNKNGFLIEKPYNINLEAIILNVLELKKEDYFKYINFNYKLAEKFTYEYYNSRIKGEIFQIKDV